MLGRFEVVRLRILVEYCKSCQLIEIVCGFQQVGFFPFIGSAVSGLGNLAAQAGVRYSLENPMAYVKSNLEGFVNILECCRKFKVSNFIYASSSSVYGDNDKFPYSEKDSVDHPISLYAATKKSTEALAHAYSSLWKLPITMLRFFTVYGPYGRPDMALYGFTDKIVAGEEILAFNNGDMQRDFTYVDDIVEGIFKILISKDKKNINNVYNIGCGKKVPLSKYIKLIEVNMIILTLFMQERFGITLFQRKDLFRQRLLKGGIETCCLTS